MNIFYLHPNTQKCASYHCDKHVVKMILESAQLLSTAHHEHDSPFSAQVYRKTHANHPSAIWTRESTRHYRWLYRLFEALSAEYTHRYSKTHKSFAKLASILQNIPDNMPTTTWSDPPQCMPSIYKQCDTVSAYRAYYLGDKTFAEWRHSKKPHWFTK